MTKTLQQLIDEKEYIMVKDVYIPYLGKCEVSDRHFYLDEGTKFATSAEVLNSERKDENGTSYHIGGLKMTIDFKAQKISGHYFKEWIGGLVEKFNFSSDFKVTKIEKDPVTETYAFDLTAEPGN